MVEPKRISRLTGGRNPQDLEVTVSRLSDEDLANYAIYLLRRHDRATKVVREIINRWQSKF